jgi:hypothetical protein
MSRASLRETIEPPVGKYSARGTLPVKDALDGLCKLVVAQTGSMRSRLRNIPGEGRLIE